jgi:hypothetical protein
LSFPVARAEPAKDQALVALDLTDPEVKAALEAAAEEATKGLRQKNGELLSEKKALADRLKAIPDDFDPDELTTLRKDRLERERKKAEEAGEFKKLEEQLVANHRKEVETLQAQLAELDGALNEEMIVARAAEVLAADDVGGSPRLLLPHIRGSAKIVKGDDGKRRVVIVGEDGKTPLLRKDAKSASDTMGLKDFALSLRENPEYAGAFKGSGAGGSGAPAGGGGGAGGAGNVLRINRNDPVAMGKITDAQLKAEAAGTLKIEYVDN